MVEDNENIEFSQRLNELLDARDFPARNYGRQKELAKKYTLVQQSVGQWLNGEGMPKTTLMMRLARDFCCNFEWLALGTGPMDVDPATQGHQAEMVRRMATADEATRQLIEIALMEEDENAVRQLTPSLVSLVRTMKAMLREQGPARKP